MKRAKSGRRPPKRRRPSDRGDTLPAQDNVPASSARVDVLSALVEATLKLDTGNDGVRDELILAVIRSELEGRVLGDGPLEIALADAFHLIASREETSSADYRRALQSFQKSALEHRAVDNPRAFLSYLQVVAN
ncbi:MAG: hypothetical protein AAF958_02390 [Planctomycetota bacterium]